MKLRIPSVCDIHATPFAVAVEARLIFRRRLLLTAIRKPLATSEIPVCMKLGHTYVDIWNFELITYRNCCKWIVDTITHKTGRFHSPS